jgi:hypothetical protein
LTIRFHIMLRFLSDPQLRRRTTAATNKVESYNNFSAWCRFGNTEGPRCSNAPGLPDLVATTVTAARRRTVPVRADEGYRWRAMMIRCLS